VGACAVEVSAPRVLFGGIPTPPAVVTADVLRSLRSPAGDTPCSQGLRAGLRWIGDRQLPLDQAIAEAREKLPADFVEWALAAIGYGYGYGHSDVYGSGSSDGSGSDYDHGYGYGYGSGDGFGADYGSGYGSDYGEED
jgi:hypothetical protein